TTHDTWRGRRASSVVYLLMSDIARLLEIMAALRTPGTGCPWDLAQNFASIAPYTIEEAYEVADAIARGDLADLREELGALQLQAKAGKVGFDWNDPLAVLAKIREEANEIEAELTSGDRAEAAAEVGDVLFAAVNLARHLGIDPEAALRSTNEKFERRFAAVEHALAQSGKSPAQATLAEMDLLWNEAKAGERAEREDGRLEPGR